MARKRMIDPSFWTDEKLGECCIQARYLFAGLFSNADDEGYGRANPKLLRSLIFPYDDLRASDLEKWLSQLGGLGLVVLYTVGDQAYYYLPNFLKHQTINKPTASIFPKPQDTLPENYGSTTVALPPKRKEENRREVEEKRKEENKGRFAPPTREEVAAYCQERQNNVDPQRWYDYYCANGWMVGKNKMKDWKAAVRTWERNQYGNHQDNGSGNPFLDMLREEENREQN